jgi:hypothetical protein
MPGPRFILGLIWVCFGLNPDFGCSTHGPDIHLKLFKAVVLGDAKGNEFSVTVPYISNLVFGQQGD